MARGVCQRGVSFAVTSCQSLRSVVVGDKAFEKSGNLTIDCGRGGRK